MADTRRTWAALATLYADNTAGAISAQDLRDLVASVQGHVATAAPTTSNDETQGYQYLSAWLDITTPASPELHICFDPATGAALWVKTYPAASGSGDVTGPASNTDGNFAAFDGADGKTLKDSGKKASDFATSTQGDLADSAMQPNDDAADLGSGAATSGQVLTADGSGAADWATPSGGGGATAFTGLSDVPSAYTGEGGKRVAVKSDEGGLEFVAAPVAGVSVNAQTGTTYTLVLGDADKLVTLDNSSAVTLTAPTNASVAFPVGSVIAGAQIGAGLVSIVGATGVTINGVTPGSEASAGQWSSWALTKLAADTWLLTGGIA